MPARVVEVAFLGNTRDLEAALTRAGLTVDATSGRFKAAAASAGRAAAEQARAVGASADEQAAAAGKAAAAFSESSAKMSAAQRAAGDAAARATKVIGGSLSAQEAAYARAAAVQGEYAASTRRTAAGIETLKTKFAGFGAMAAKVAGVGALGAGFFSVKGAGELQQQMEMLHTQAGATQGEVNRMTKSVENMAGSVATGPEVLAQGLYHVESVGKHGADALRILRVAAEGAKIGGANLEDVTNALDAAVVSGIPGVKNYSQAMGALNAIVGSGDMRMQDLAQALGTGLLSPMKRYGLSLRDVGAALAVFGDNNIRGADAATKLSSAVRIMAAPSQAASKALGVVHLTTLQLANDMRSGGLIKALEDLQGHLTASGATASQQALIIARAFGGRQSTGVQVLLGQLDRLKQKQEEVGAGAHKFGSDWAAYLKLPIAEWDKFKASVQAAADKLGGALIPKLEAAARAISNVVSWLHKHRDVAHALAVTLTGVLGTALTVYAYTKAVAFIGATKSMISGLAGLASKAAGVAASMAAKFGLIDAAAATTATEVGAASTEVEAANAGAAGSFLAVGGAASTATGRVGAAAAASATAVGTADAAIETANAAAGASFMAMLGPIGAVGAAVVAIQAEFHPGGDISSFDAKVEARIAKIKAAAQARSDAQTTAGLTADAGVPRLPSKPVYAPTANTGPHTRAPLTTQVANAYGKGLSAAALQTLLGGGKTSTGGGSRSTGGKTIRVFGGLSPDEQKFVAYMAADTGLSPRVIAAWVRNEEGTRSSPAGHKDSNWLNVGWTDKGPAKGTNLGQWKDPSSAALLTAQWMRGQGAMAQAYGPASAGIKAILGTKGLTANAQLAAIQSSGWASGGEAILRRLYAQSGTPTVGVKVGNAHYNTAAATSAIPAAVATMLQTALALTGTSYTHGGGHGGWDPVAELKKIGVDCSGFVSAVLHSGGVRMPGPQTTAGLPNYLAKGTGSLVTVYDREAGSQAHTLIRILGKWFESGGNSKFNPKGGVSQLTAAQAAGELSGGGFHAYHPTGLGAPYASTKSLSALGISAGTAAQAATPEGQATFAAQLAAAIAKYNAALKKAAGSIIKSYQSLEQNGTVRGLEKGLGVRTGGKVAGRLHSALENVIGLGPNAHIGFDKQLAMTNDAGTPTMAAINRTLMPALTKATKGTETDKQFNALIVQLRGSHDKALQALIPRLLAAHKSALQALAQELYAAQVNKDAEALNQQASAIKDQTTLVSNYYSAALNVAKATEQQVDDAAQAQVQAVDDMASYVRDQWAGLTQAIDDATQSMGDTSDAVVAGIADQAQIQVDILGERGLYGLNLIAQQLKVAYDQDKAYWDQQIALAKQNLDAITGQWHQAVANAQLNVDQVTLQSDTLVAAAQQNYDTIQIASLLRIGSAQSHADQVATTDDLSTWLAQVHVDLLANAPKAQQDAANATLGLWTAKSGIDSAAAAANLASVTGIANAADQTASHAYSSAQNAASAAIAAANAALTTITGQASAAIAAATQSVAAVTGTAAQVLAAAQAAADIAAAEAQTQFAGSGTVVNIYGIPTNDASAIGDAVSWVARTQIGLNA